MSDSLVAGLAIALQVLAVTAAAPIVVGVTRQVRARLEGRAGAGVLQLSLIHI